VTLTAENTAIVLDSTADFPEARERFENWRVVPLYVRFGEESYRDYVDLGPEEFYARLADAPEPPQTAAPSPGDFAAVYEELAARYERIFSLQFPAALSATLGAAAAAAADFPGVRVIDTHAASAASAMLALAVQRRLERGTSDEEIDELVKRFCGEHGLLFTTETLEYLRRGGRIGRAAAFAGTLLSVKPILTIRDDEAGARNAEGARRVSRRARGRVSRRADAAHRPRSRGGARAAREARGGRTHGAPARQDRGGDVARPGPRHARGAGYRRALLVRRPRALMSAGPGPILGRGVGDDP
jgi:DegV family protein with EDD domain